MKNLFYVTAACCACLSLAGASAFGDTDQLSQLLKRELTKKYPDTRIEITGPVRWVSGGAPATVSSFSYLGESARGDLQFSVLDAEAQTQSEGWVSFAAWTPALTAIRRIHPGERLSRDGFSVQDVNVAAGMGREYRGVILPKETDVSTLEARQTILEGQYALTSAVQKVPDLRRGEVVRVRMFSGAVTLSTSGTAEEPAYALGTVRVMTAKSKRIVIGKLGADGVVEVRL